MRSRIMKLHREFENEKKRTIDESAQSSSSKIDEIKKQYEGNLHHIEIKQREILAEETEKQRKAIHQLERKYTS